MAGEHADDDWQARALKAFNQIDVDNNDSLSKDELVMMLETGTFPIVDTVADTTWTADRLMEALDTDGDGSVSRDEFLKFISSPALGEMLGGAIGGEFELQHQHRRMSADTSWINSLLAKVVVSVSNADGAEIVDDELLNKAALQTKIDSHSASLSSMANDGSRSRFRSTTTLDDDSDEYDRSFNDGELRDALGELRASSTDDDSDGSVIGPSVQEAEYARRLHELQAEAAKLSVDLAKERGLREAVEAKVLANERLAVELKVQLEMAKIAAATKQTEFQGQIDKLQLELRKARNSAVVIKQQLDRVGGQKASTDVRLRTMLNEHKQAMTDLAL